MREELLKLAERVEALSGPDREVAKDMFRALFPEKVPSPIVEQGYGWREDESGWWLATGEDSRTPPKTIYPPNWLSSLDAAMTLVPEGCGWSLVQATYEKSYGCIESGDDRTPDLEARAATPALALCAAALRALAKEE